MIKKTLKLGIENKSWESCRNMAIFNRAVRFSWSGEKKRRPKTGNADSEKWRESFGHDGLDLSHPLNCERRYSLNLDAE